LEAPPRVAVVVLNYHGGEDVLRCVEAIIRGSAPAHVIVSDNGSTDGSADRIEGRFPDAEVLRNGKNLGYCEGNNVGIRRALERGARSVLLLNDDAFVLEGALSRMLETLEGSPEVGIVGPRIVFDHDPDLVWAAGGAAGFAPNVLSLRGHLTRGEDLASLPEKVDFVPGCALLVKAEVLREVGLLDPVFFAYFEDADFCYRARKAGHGVVYEPRAIVRHRVSASTGGGLSPTRKYLMGLNSWIFLRRHGTFSLWAAWLVFDVILLPVALLHGVLRGRGRAALAKARGILHGVLGRTADASSLGQEIPPRPGGEDPS
jgi:hypothetical protein